MAYDVLTDPVASNYLATLAAPPAVSPAPAPTQRVSAMQGLGELGDAISRMYGHQGVYQSGLDEQAARDQLAITNNHANQEWQQNFTKGGQEVDANTLKLDTARNAILKQTVDGLSSVFAKAEQNAPGSGKASLAKVFPMVAQQLNLPDDKKAQLAAALADDPQGTLEALSNSLTPKEKDGSVPGSIQEFNLLKSLTPAQIAALPPAARQRLAAMADPHALTPYQQEQIALGRGRLGVARDRTGIARQSANTRAAAAGQSGWSPESIDAAAQNVEKTPTLLRSYPPAIRAAITQRVTDRAAANGTSQDIAGTAAAFKADTGSLSFLQKQTDALVSAQNEAKSNGQLVLQALGKGAAGGQSPIINRWVQAGRRSVAGDADVVTLNRAIQGYLGVASKIIERSTGSVRAAGVHAQQQLEHDMNTAMNPAQIKAAMSQFEAEMENARKGNSDEIATIRGRMRSPAVVPKTSTPRPTATGPNGRKVQWNGSAWVPL